MSEPPPGHACDHSTGCITCGDVAEEMRVVEVDAASGLALCGDRGGTLAPVETALVDPVAVGDTLLVHAGTAIARAEGAAA